MVIIKIEIATGGVRVGNINLAFTPIEFTYYRYFAELVLKGHAPITAELKIFAPKGFSKNILDFQRESFRKQNSS